MLQLNADSHTKRKSSIETRLCIKQTELLPSIIIIFSNWLTINSYAQQPLKHIKYDQITLKIKNNITFISYSKTWVSNQTEQFNENSSHSAYWLADEM